MVLPASKPVEEIGLMVQTPGVAIFSLSGSSM